MNGAGLIIDDGLADLARGSLHREGDDLGEFVVRHDGNANGLEADDASSEEDDGIPPAMPAARNFALSHLPSSSPLEATSSEGRESLKDAKICVADPFPRTSATRIRFAVNSIPIIHSSGSLNS